MSTVDRVRASRNPQEALLAIAGTLDALLEQLGRIGDRAADPPAAPDPWGAWAQDAHDFPDALVHPSPADVEYLRDRITQSNDPEARAALEAELRLLEDPGSIIQGAVPDGRMVRIETAESGAIVDLPAPDARRRAARYQWAREHQLENFLPDWKDKAFELAETFAKGGPLWLYHSEAGRDAILAMPAAWRAALVEDIEQDSPRLAQEVGRDILKSEDSVPADSIIDAQERAIASGELR